MAQFQGGGATAKEAGARHTARLVATSSDESSVPSETRLRNSRKKSKPKPKGMIFSDEETDTVPAMGRAFDLSSESSDDEQTHPARVSGKKKRNRKPSRKPSPLREAPISFVESDTETSAKEEQFADSDTSSNSAPGSDSAPNKEFKLEVRGGRKLYNSSDAGNSSSQDSDQGSRSTSSRKGSPIRGARDFDSDSDEKSGSSVMQEGRA